MNKNQKCDEMTRLVIKIENVRNDKAEAVKEFNEEIKGLEDQLLGVARENADQTEIDFTSSKNMFSHLLKGRSQSDDCSPGKWFDQHFRSFVEALKPLPHTWNKPRLAPGIPERTTLRNRSDIDDML